MPKVLVSDPLAEDGIAKLRAVASLDVDVKLGLTPDELKAIIGDYEALAVRSETKVTADILAAATKLQIIGRAGVGVDNIDVQAATQKGVVVVNSPDGNTLAAAELTVGLILALARKIPQGDATLKAGRWDRKKFVGNELYGKTVGIIGLGKIGYAVAQRLKGFEVELIAYNPFVSEAETRHMGVEPVSLDDLVRRSDYITVHAPLNNDTRNLIGTTQFAQMKNGVRLINVARGGIIDEQALADAARSGKVSGYAVDVFSKEPPDADNPLLAPDVLANNVLTPHLGASSEEAQIKVAVDVCEQIIDVLAGRPARTAVNLPSLSETELQAVTPYLNLAEKIGSLHMQLARHPLQEGRLQEGRPIAAVEVVFNGDFGNVSTSPITRAVLRGLMTPGSKASESVNMVNAPYLAQAKGIKVVEARRPATPDHACLLSVQAQLPVGSRSICGTVYGGEAHIVHIDGYHVDIVPNGSMIITQHTDAPGIVGKVGTLLGSNGVNIAGMNVGRQAAGGRAVMVLMIDEPISDDLMLQIRAIGGMETAQLVTL